MSNEEYEAQMAYERYLNDRADERDAQIATLTERLRAVEAERDEAHATIRARSAAHSQVADENGRLGAQLSALRAELERKDAALVDANKNIHMLYDLLVESDAPTKQYDYSTRKESAIIGAMKFLAALQPKEPPCQKA